MEIHKPMMPLASYLGFVLASVLLILLPGPNVAVIVGNSLSGGRSTGLATVFGTASATAVQIALVVVGLAVLVASAAPVFSALRWLGVGYLLILGTRAWLANPATADAPPPVPRSPRRAAATGFLVSLTNPKTLLFHGAFLPQFVDPAGDVRFQLLVLGATFTGLAATLDSGWAILADRLRAVLTLRPRLRDRVVGTSLIAAAAGLALAHGRG